jgi:hypothetical protein
MRVFEPDEPRDRPEAMPEAALANSNTKITRADY